MIHRYSINTLTHAKEVGDIRLIENMMIVAEMTNDELLLNYIVKKKKFYQVKNKRGYTVLGDLAKQGLNLLIEHLYKLGADISIKDDNGDAILHKFAMSCSVDGVKFASNHIDINIKNNSNQTPLHCAVTHDRGQNVDFLCSLEKVDMNVVDSNGHTPVQLANEFHIQSRQAFAKHGFDFET